MNLLEVSCEDCLLLMSDNNGLKCELYGYVKV